MLCAKDLVPESVSDPEPPVRVPKVVLHMVSLELSQNGNIQFRPKVEVVMQAVIQGDCQMESEGDMQSLSCLQSHEIVVNQENGKLVDEHSVPRKGQFVLKPREGMMDVVPIARLTFLERSMQIETMESIFQ